MQRRGPVGEIAMQVTDSERALLHELHNVKKDPLGKRIIHFSVSLAPQNGDMARKIDGAKQFVKKSFAKSPYAEVFNTDNGDIFVTYSHITVSEVLGVCAKVERLFCDDTVISQRNAWNEFAFYKVCDAVKDLDKTFAVLKGILARAQAEPDAFSKRPMTPENLSFLMERLRTADVRNCIFNQPIYAIDHKVPSIEFLEFYISSQEIEAMLLPEVSLSAHPWLFHALGQEFDRILLKVMSREIGTYRHKSFSLNIALGTVLGREFTEFCESLPTKLAGKIVVEVHKTDLVQNYSLWKDVRSLLDARGLKICVDGLDWHDFDVLNVGRLRPDFIKVMWGNDLLTAQQGDLAAFIDAVKAHDQSEIVLARCDNPKAFPFAKTLGIRYVQGKLADQFFKSKMEF
jgi:EAL domain-containing protein (putative c-di-GMP-specific phosphodiesterase class I)